MASLLPMDGCIFASYYGEECKGSDLSKNRDKSRVDSIISASQKRNDTLHEQLIPLLSADENLKVQYHANCANKYCSTKSLDKAPQAPPPKKPRSSETVFIFKQHCLYCGLNCQVKRDPKHPNRWKETYLVLALWHYCKVRQVKIKYKQYIEEKCYQRKDEWGEKVLLRLAGIPNDIVASDGRYHKDCRTKLFLNVKDEDEEDTVVDVSFLQVIKCMTADKGRIWNSVELHNMYTANNDNTLFDGRKAFITHLMSYFDGEVIPFQARGFAKLICFKDHARGILKMTKKEDDGVEGIGRQVNAECKAINIKTDNYSTHINLETAMDSTSPTLQRLLESISIKLSNSLYAALIGNIVTSIVQNRPTQLQLALGVLLRQSKSILNHLYDYRVTCSYDEVLRFKKSAAANSASDGYLQGVPASNSLLQIITDNYDADISSQNSKIQCHCLATILTKNVVGTVYTNEGTIFPRLTKQEMSYPIADAHQAEVTPYYGPKKPPMTDVPKSNLPSEFSKMQKISRARAEEIDFKFFLDIVSTNMCPEYNGYCSRLNRKQGQSLRPKTKIVYMPLLDMIPATATTMQTSIVQAKKIASEHGQNFCVYTSDQQLYRIALAVLWNNPELSKDFYLRLGGMHFLMSYIGSIGTLMNGSGLKEILEKGFGGVTKMLTGKKFPQCFRALRMLVEEILRPILNSDVDSYSKLMEVLEEKSKKSKTTRLWVDVLIKPIFLCLLYVRAEREGDWPLHLEAVESMLPLFYAAGHVNYARDGLYYLQTMKAMPEEVRNQFLKGEHTVQHTSTVWSGIWSDMAIETSYMRFGKSSMGIVGQSLNPETVKIWAYSLNSCCEVVDCLESMRKKEVLDNSLHKEEMKSRITKDGVDRDVLRKRLECSIDILDPSQHSKGLVNIATGKVVTDPTINVYNSSELGKMQLKKFEENLPTGYYDPISQVVKTMGSTRKVVKVGDKIILDPEVIYARALALKCANDDFDFEQMLMSELAPHPTSMFDEDGLLRTSKQKSKLMTALKVEVSARTNTADATAVFLDGCAILWVVSWPSKGTVQNYLNNFRNYVLNKTKTSDVYLVFDRYLKDSIKGLTRMYRDNGASRMYQLTPDTELPPKDVLLKVSSNKEQLIQLIVANCISEATVFVKNKLVITGSEPVPLQIWNGVVTSRQELKTTQEEADTILVHQVTVMSPSKAVVVADDTDVFVLLLHFLFTGDITTQVYMQPTSMESSAEVTDINATYKKHITLVPNILAAHALSGCDTVGATFGIGKATALKALNTKEVSLQSIGDLSKSFEECVNEGTRFFLCCYGQKKLKTLTEARIKVWKNKIAKTNSTAPKLETLPPTDAAFHENLKRAHLQAAIWRNTMHADPPKVDVLNFGWTKDPSAACLLPSTVPDGIQLVPEELLKIMRCACCSESACKNLHCSCNKSHLPCSTFCECEGAIGCFNPLTVIKETEHLNLEQE